VAVLTFDRAEATEIDRTGGKGSSLARLARAGFAVPPGFVVTTAAYDTFIEVNDLQPRIDAALESLDHADPEQVERVAAGIREEITSAGIPAELAGTILESYAAIGTVQNPEYVAVRSSGTAEDLAEASFAGQHDSYLDIRGADAVLDAVRRCWASLWTARATAYRRQKGFDHSAVRLAVVVQRMVEADVSGVMFTANPMTTAVDEIVINAAWGLGEGIVSGVLTPDQFTLQREDLRVKETALGSKAVTVVRDPDRAHGVVHREVPAAERDRACLTGAQLTALGELGRRVQEYYGDFPQDIEWAFAGDELYLLQSRDVTGVEFSWDEDLEDYVDLDRIPDDAILSRAFSDAVWTGRITPLFYSLRGEVFTRQHVISEEMWGVPEAAKERMWKYHKGEAYYNSRIEYLNHTTLLPKFLRNPAALMQWSPPAWYEAAGKEPENLWGWLKALARIRVQDPANGHLRWYTDGYRQLEERKRQALGLEPEQIRGLSDKELVRYVDKTVALQKEWVEDLWTGFFLHVPNMTAAFLWMLSNWYTGTNPMVFSDLITGLPKPTITLKENIEMWGLAERIRASDELMRLFKDNQDAAFFEACEGSADGREFLAAYREFLVEFGHRGHADRDIWYARRSEDPGIDYRTFSVYLSSDGEPPGAAEHKLIAQREAATEEVLESIRRLPFGSVKAELFKAVHEYLLRFFVYRDDERHHTDRHTFAKKRACAEVGRRLVERGVLERDDDFYYLSKNELLELFRGGNATRLVKAKIEARRRNCERYRTEWTPPMYIRGNGTVAHDVNDTAVPTGGQAEDGVLRGVGTSRGTVVGTARIVPTQADLGRVQKGDILVTFSTDPGWTTVFLVLSGLVLETGGMLAHGSCISREYGIPAVQVNDAMSLIEDGSTIEVNGDTGEVRVLAGPGEAAPEPATTPGQVNA
jgi:pyruvate,water dikinase